MESKVTVVDSSVTALQQQNVATNVFSPKYNLSKIKTKYLILDILSFSGYRDIALLMLYGGSRKLRQMLIQDYQIFLQYTLPQVEVKLRINNGFILNGLTVAALIDYKVSLKINGEADLKCIMSLKDAYPEFKEVDHVEIGGFHSWSA